MPMLIGMRTGMRSSSQPTSGLTMPIATRKAVAINEICWRLQPNSLISGVKKIPMVPILGPITMKFTATTPAITSQP